ncbi:MAG: carboxypeptidase M32 [Gaiellaceae bacterium]
MNERLDELRFLAAEISDLEKVSGLLSWDEETHMPPEGAVARAEQKATIQRLAHERWISDDLGGLLEELAPLEQELGRESDDASLVRVMRRDHEKARRIPVDLHAEIVRAGSLGYRAWLEARAGEDYSILLPHLQKNLDLRLRYIDCLGPQEDPYDALLDDYEPGMKTTDVDPVFDQLKTALLPMIAAVKDAEPVDDRCLQGHFPVEAQRRFSIWAMERWGFDPASWRLDRTVHPFATSFATSDIRLTTRFSEDHLGGILACLHEFGHGLYERQVSRALERTPLASGVSAALHESQSRMWENLVGRSLATWRSFYPTLQLELPEQFRDVPLETFHRAINKVQPTLVRVEADEVTYNLHIILRYELEREMLAGTLSLTDLPDAFDAKMHDYLGIDPPDLVRGVLQDAHWSDLGFGYFPTYALGNVISVQMWQRAQAELGDFDEQFEQGEFGPLREWLGRELHRHGRKFSAKETLERATGGPIDPQPYLGYLERKLADLFGAAVL